MFPELFLESQAYNLFPFHLYLIFGTSDDDSAAAVEHFKPPLNFYQNTHAKKAILLPYGKLLRSSLDTENIVLYNRTSIPVGAELKPKE